MRQRASVGRGAFSTSRSKPALVWIHGFSAEHLASHVCFNQPHGREESADLHWFVHRFPPLRQVLTFGTGGTDRDLLKLTIYSQPKGCERRVRWSSASWSGPTTRGPRLAVLAPASLRRRRRAPFSLPCPLSLPPPRAKPPKKPQKRRKRKNEQKKY